jgi:hypothetical protein
MYCQVSNDEAYMSFQDQPSGQSETCQLKKKINKKINF